MFSITLELPILWCRTFADAFIVTSQPPENQLKNERKIFIEQPKRREIETETDREILQTQCVRKEFLWYNRRVEMPNKTKILDAWSEGATKSDGITSVVSACLYVCVYAVCTIQTHLWGLQWIALCVHSRKKTLYTENIRNVKAEFTFCWLLERCLSKRFSFYTSVHRLYTNVFENIVGFKCKGIIALVSCIFRQSL